MCGTHAHVRGFCIALMLRCEFIEIWKAVQWSGLRFYGFPVEVVIISIVGSTHRATRSLSTSWWAAFLTVLGHSVYVSRTGGIFPMVLDLFYRLVTAVPYVRLSWIISFEFCWLNAWLFRVFVTGRIIHFETIFWLFRQSIKHINWCSLERLVLGQSVLVWVKLMWG